MVYRLANQVYVMGVAPAHGNVFFASRVVNAATHHLVAVNRGISVTPDRIANRFPEVRSSQRETAHSSEVFMRIQIAHKRCVCVHVRLLAHEHALCGFSDPEKCLVTLALLAMTAQMPALARSPLQKLAVGVTQQLTQIHRCPKLICIPSGVFGVLRADRQWRQAGACDGRCRGSHRLPQQRGASNCFILLVGSTTVRSKVSFVASCVSGAVLLNRSAHQNMSSDPAGSEGGEAAEEELHGEPVHPEEPEQRHEAGAAGGRRQRRRRQVPLTLSH